MSFIKMNRRKLILYIACSLDGYIAGPNDDLSFLDCVQIEGEDYGYSDFITTVDTIIVGRKTYDWVIKRVKEFPHEDKDVIVLTRTARDREGNITFYNGDLKELVTKLKVTNGKNIFCDGGAEIVNEFLKEKLFDELIISVIPVILGDGIRLFLEGIPEQGLELISVKSFDAGLAQLHYKFKKKD
jgi:dihydrofolate reductase